MHLYLEVLDARKMLLGAPRSDSRTCRVHPIFAWPSTLQGKKTPEGLSLAIAGHQNAAVGVA